MESLLQVMIGAVAGGLIGGGAIAAIAYRALKDRLISDLATIFARQSQIREVTREVEQMRTVAMAANDASAQNAAAILRLQERDANDRERLRDTLERIETRLTQMDEQQRQDQRVLDRTVAVLAELEKRVDRHER